MRIRTLVPCVLGLWLIGCGTHNSGDGGGSDAAGSGPFQGLIKVLVTPADQTLVNSATVAATSTYTATGVFEDGHMADLTSQVAFTLDDPTLGGFATAGAFTSATGKGGRGTVAAIAGTITGTTTVTLDFTQSWNDPASTDLPADPAAPFSTGPAVAARNPDLVYPNDAVVVPPNLGQLEFHFHPGSTSNTLFQLTFSSPIIDVTVYLRCTDKVNNGCIYLPDAQLWSWLSETAKGGDPISWSIKGTDDTGTGVGASPAQTLAFAPDDLTGGIYYWTTTAEAVMRWDFASTTQTTPMQFIGTSLESGACIGCHALSRDGKKLVAEAAGQYGGASVLVDVATTTVKNSYGGSTKTNFESWNPDGSMYAAVWADNADYDGTTNYNIKLLSGSNGTLVSTVDVGGTAAHPTDHPDWSADGSRIAFSRVGTFQTLQRSFEDSISTVAQNADGTWAAPTPLVAQAALTNRYYPAFAPDGRLLLFDESHCTSGSATGGECDGDTDPDAKIWAVDSIAGGTPVLLTNANKPGVADGTTTALTNSFPKWNPFVARKTNAGGHLAWVTFSSTRQFGLRNPSGNTWLWMAAVDLDAPGGVDPSSVAFALPFQDLTTSNHIAQWAEQVVGPISRQFPTKPGHTLAIPASAYRARP